MEDFLGWVIMLLVPLALVGLVYYMAVVRPRKQAKKDQQEWQQYEQTAKAMRERARRDIKTASSNKPPSTTSKYADTTSSSTASSSSNDSLLSDLATLYVLNSALSHGSASAKVDYDAGTIKTESSSDSWGFSDSSSRKSASDSFSSSDSSSSWSDSSSSSSDSGPSSDW